MSVDFVRLEAWCLSRPVNAEHLDGVPFTDCVAEVAASVDDIEEVERDSVVNTAASFVRDVSVLQASGDASCYWLGEPNPHGHPAQPGAADAYAFSCTTFVHHCYQAAGLQIVDVQSIPIVSTEERFQFARYDLQVQESPFRRLCCGHLIAALEPSPQRIPFRPADGDWLAVSDKKVLESLVDAGRASLGAEPGAP